MNDLDKQGALDSLVEASFEPALEEEELGLLGRHPAVVMVRLADHIRELHAERERTIKRLRELEDQLAQMATRKATGRLSYGPIMHPNTHSVSRRVIEKERR